MHVRMCLLLLLEYYCGGSSSQVCQVYNEDGLLLLLLPLNGQHHYVDGFVVLRGRFQRWSSPGHILRGGVVVLQLVITGVSLAWT